MGKGVIKKKTINSEIEFIDPVINTRLKVLSVPRERLEVAVYQRKPSMPHIRSLASSIRKMGFLVPLVVYPEKDKYIIIDGQHRFLAGENVGMESFLCVVVPKELGTKMINLNIEKQPNIREKAYVAYNLYNYLLETNPSIKETDGQVEDAVELPHYITLGFAYHKVEKFHGSAFEPIISKCDGYLDLTLKKAREEREKRAEILLNIDEIITDLISRMQEMQLSIHPFIRRDILSHVNPVKGKGKRGEFFEVFEGIKRELKKYQENPQLLVEIKSEESL